MIGGPRQNDEEYLSGLDIKELEREKLIAEVQAERIKVYEISRSSFQSEKLAKWEARKLPANLFAIYLGIIVTSCTIWYKLGDISEQISERNQLNITTQTLTLVENLKNKEKAATAAFLLSTQGPKVIPLLIHHLETTEQPASVISVLSTLAKQKRHIRVKIEKELLANARRHLNFNELPSLDAYITQTNFIAAISQVTHFGVVEACRYFKLVSSKAAVLNNEYTIGLIDPIGSARDKLGPQCV